MSLPPLKKGSSNPSDKRRKAIDPYLFNISDYKVIKTINRGGFGVINLVQNKKSHQEYAAKTNLIQDTTSQNSRFISREVRILIQFQHPTVIKFRGFSLLDFEGHQNITILMDYMKGGSLADLLDLEIKGLCPTDYDNTKRQIILIGISRGMMLLHKHHVIHRDLKPENILLDVDMKPRITDFGLSKFFDPHHSMSQSMTDSGTVAYMAPEVIGSDHFNTKADVYAFGILMYELIGGRRAYSELFLKKKKITPFQLKKKVEEGFRPKIDFPIKKGLKTMIKKCWDKDPKERPTFDEIFKKLSLSDEDYFLEFEMNYEEPKIVDDKDDDDEEDESGLNMKYCFNDVDVNEILDYVDEIKVEIQPTTTTTTNVDRENEELKNEIQKMKSDILSLKEKILPMQVLITNQNNLITLLRNEISALNKEKGPKGEEIKREYIDHGSKIRSLENRFGRFFSVDINLEGPGILALLKERQKNPFDRLFVASQSSNDIYSLLVPNAYVFGTSNLGNAYIEFELETEITICGVKITTAYDFHAKSFDIVINGKTVFSVKEATELNGNSKSMTITFSPIRSKKVRFLQTGPNWSGHNFINTRAFELLSSDSKYLKGVFATLVDQSEDKDPHKSKVIIYAQCFDHNSFHSLNSTKTIHTYSNENSWFQVELTRGTAILIGFRLGKLTNFNMKSFKVICTDDSKKPESSWTTLIEIDEKTKDDHKLLDVYEFPHPSPPTRFVRLIQTGKNWKDNYTLSFMHFDLFGSYF